jgi:hypothetical protein
MTSQSKRLSLNYRSVSRRLFALALARGDMIPFSAGIQPWQQCQPWNPRIPSSVISSGNAFERFGALYLVPVLSQSWPYWLALSRPKYPPLLESRRDQSVVSVQL